MDQQQKLQDATSKLEAQVEIFRTKKETLKATYTAAEASSHINEAVAGISGSMSDAGAALQRAQDKVQDMQARSGALDDLLTSEHDDIQRQLDAASTASTVDAQLAALKAQTAGELPEAK